MTDRLTIDGFTVYLQERPNGAVATVRSAPWTQSQPQAPLASFVAASSMAALRHAEQWVQQQAPEASSQEPPMALSQPWREQQSSVADDQRRQARSWKRGSCWGRGHQRSVVPASQIPRAGEAAPSRPWRRPRPMGAAAWRIQILGFLSRSTTS